MSQSKAIEHQTFSNILISRRIKLSKLENEAVAIYFAFEDVNSPQLESKYAKLFNQGKTIVKQLIQELGY
jgi:hypothetical protein